ncbi:hypothetical protein [Anaerococcus hydrogenalis]|uniref:hypothetical protein n=1 Tax=Anaerococcus hydrogenalis TaxID=33029 RepID=UPI001D79DE85|nr:hypothetical protein [Anaerococcus hydrogenalis]MBS5988517.1 hypothetical protein [Anaerococcus hydrogenalis]
MRILKIIFPIFLLGISLIFLIKKLDKNYKKEKNLENDGNYLAEGIGIGLIFGAAFGSLFDDMGYWISVGMLLGLTIGQAIEKKEA